MTQEKSLPGKRFMMYVIGFIFNLSYAIPTYVNSSFLSKFTSESWVGIVYTAGSILAIIAFMEMASVLRRFGNFKTTIALIFLEIISLAGLATGQTTLMIIGSFILNFVTIALLNFTLDIFLEEFSTDSRTGKIRGIFLTVVNSAWLISPLLASWILGDNIYGNMYAVSGILLIPTLLLVFFGLHDVKEPRYERLSFWKSFAFVWANKDLRGVLTAQFLLQFFYAWMVIYSPIYLHQTVGFDWATIGIIFTVMLLPFVFIEAPLGRMADHVGEKKMLAWGFFIIGLSTGIIAFVTDHNALLWAAILFATRCGAAIVEIMSDTYLFKHIDASNTHVITFSRMARPMAYIIGPVLATLLIPIFDIKGLFIVLGLLMLYGIRPAKTITETRKVNV